MKYSLLFFAALWLSSCMTTRQKQQEIVGIWEMEKVLENKKDVTSEYDPRDERWIEFLENYTFESDGRPFGRSTGKWRFQGKLLYLDSTAGPENDKYWQVSFRKGKMVWRSTGSDAAKTLQVIYTPYHR